MKPCPDRHEMILLAVYEELNPEQRRDWEQHKAACPACRGEYETWFVRPNRLVPALATACVILITFGWLGMNLIQSPDTDQDALGPSAENQTVLKDLEIIKNIEFLEEMETLQELVTVLDRNESI